MVSRGKRNLDEQFNEDEANQSKTLPKHQKIQKLLPPRPIPTVPTSVSATGPSSRHKEGKTFICITRKTKLGAYMRRCKAIVLKDGYKTLHLSAMGAAIPQLLQLSTALPSILPFSKDEIHVQVNTGTVKVHDELIPEDEDEDITVQTRGKSTLTVIMIIGDGEFEGDRSGLWKNIGKGLRHSRFNGANKNGEGKSNTIVLQEPEQEEQEML